MLSFGTANVLTELCKVINTSIPDLLLGRLSVAADVGWFSRANSTVNMISKVVEPSINFFTLFYMARIHHTSGNVNSDYLRAGSIINSVIFSALAWVALMANDIVLLLYGEKWTGAVPAIPWLCAAAAVSTLFAITTKTLISVGRPYVALNPLITLIIGKLIAVLTFYNGSLESFAISILIGELVSIPGYLYLKAKHLKINLIEWGKDTSKTAAVALLSMLLTGYLMGMLPVSYGRATYLAASFLSLSTFCLTGFYLARLPIAKEVLNA